MRGKAFDKLIPLRLRSTFGGCWLSALMWQDVFTILDETRQRRLLEGTERHLHCRSTGAKRRWNFRSHDVR